MMLYAFLFVYVMGLALTGLYLGEAFPEVQQDKFPFIKQDARGWAVTFFWPLAVLFALIVGLGSLAWDCYKYRKYIKRITKTEEL